jgi:hypothetical protein
MKIPRNLTAQMAVIGTRVAAQPIPRAGCVIATQ